jgi:hypothetical protein
MMKRCEAGPSTVSGTASIFYTSVEDPDPRSIYDPSDPYMTFKIFTSVYISTKTESGIYLYCT